MAIRGFRKVWGENGNVEMYGSTVPTNADMGGVLAQVGDICRNDTPAQGSPIGWRCIVAGTTASPAGTWESFTVHGLTSLDFTLTNTQTKALFTAPTLLVAAPAAGSLIQVINCYLKNNFLTAAFANGGVIQLGYDTGATPAASTTAAATFLTSPAANQGILLTGAMVSALESAILAKGLYIGCATQDFITGAGFISGKLLYRVITP